MPLINPGGNLSFDLVEMEVNETLVRVYSRGGRLGCLDLCRQRCRETALDLSVEEAYRICRLR